MTDLSSYLDGKDISEQIITLLQLQGAGVVSQHTVIENLPWDDLPHPDNCECRTAS
jgi:hypothetical protein